MSLDAEVLRASFATAIDRQPNLTYVFYEDLFTRHPKSRSLCVRRPPETQERMLAETLLATLAHAVGDGWTPASEQAWREALTAIAGLMLAGYPRPDAVE